MRARAYTGPIALHPPSDGCSPLYMQEQKARRLPTRRPVDSIAPRALASGKKPFCLVKSVWEEKALPLEKKKVMETEVREKTWGTKFLLCE